MLPKIVRVKPMMSRGGSLALAVCAIALLGVPTFHGVAQSQEVEKPTGPTRVVKEKPAEKEKKPVGTTVKNAARDTQSGDAAGVVAQTTAGPMVPAPSVEFLPRPTPAEQQMVAKLAELTSMKFEDVPLEDALRKLSQGAGINIVVDQPSFKAHNIPQDALITLSVADVSLRSCLKLMLEPHELTFDIADEVLKIIPEAEAPSRSVTRIYPVPDLLDDPADFESLIAAIQQSVARGTWDKAATPLLVTLSSAITGEESQSEAFPRCRHLVAL